MSGQPLVMPATSSAALQGVDLSNAEPIGAVAMRLSRAATPLLFAVEYIAALREMNVSLSLMWMADSPEDSDGLWSGQPCDDQMEVRDARTEALRDLMPRQTETGRERRRALVELLRRQGQFIDNRPFPSVEAAARAWIEAGGKLMVRPSNDEAHVEAAHDAAHLDSPEDGWPLRQLFQRYEATIRKKGAMERLTAFVIREGTDLGNGWTVFETADCLEQTL